MNLDESLLQIWLEYANRANDGPRAFADRRRVDVIAAWLTPARAKPETL